MRHNRNNRNTTGTGKLKKRIYSPKPKSLLQNSLILIIYGMEISPGRWGKRKMRLFLQRKQSSGEDK